jgi:hypothetical protein
MLVSDTGHIALRSAGFQPVPFKSDRVKEPPGWRRYSENDEPQPSNFTV